MRFLNKYKSYSNINCSIKKLPLRILKFKRPKWTKIQLKINKKTTKKFNKRTPFINWEIKKIGSRFLPNMKKHYKKRLQTRKTLANMFDNSIKLKQKTQETFKEKVLSFYFIKPLYRIDLLLWYLHYFHTSYESKQNINNKVVLVNNKSVKSNYFVKKGDVLTFNSKKNIINCKKLYKKNITYFSFLEIDYYSNTIVIVKDLKDLAIDDFKLLIQENLDIRHLFYK